MSCLSAPLEALARACGFAHVAAEAPHTGRSTTRASLGSDRFSCFGSPKLTVLSDDAMVKILARAPRAGDPDGRAANVHRTTSAVLADRGTKRLDGRRLPPASAYAASKASLAHEPSPVLAAYIAHVPRLEMPLPQQAMVTLRLRAMDAAAPMNERKAAVSDLFDRASDVPMMLQHELFNLGRAALHGPARLDLDANERAALREKLGRTVPRIATTRMEAAAKHALEEIDSVPERDR